MAREPVRIPHAALRVFTERILEVAGLSADHARITTDILVETDLRGVHSHGVSLLPTYVRRLHGGLTNPRPHLTVAHERGATAVLDGDHGMGHVTGYRAMTMAIALAKTHGIGMVAVRRSTHYGMAGYYAMMAAQEQMIGYSTSNAGADMVAWQGQDPVLGNNPIAYAVPARQYPPIVLDIACSVAAKGRIRIAQMSGQRIPRGWVLGDHEDPEVAWTHPLLPFGAHKGSGLAVIGEVLSAALPAALLSVQVLRSGPIGGEARDPRGIGHLAAAIDIATFRPLDEFLQTVDSLIDAVKGTRPLTGYDEVLVPGEPEHRHREVAMREGITLHASVAEALRVLGDVTGVPFPSAP